MNKVYRCTGCGNAYEYASEVKPTTVNFLRINFLWIIAQIKKMPVGECPACGSIVHAEENYNQVEQSINC